MRPRLYQSAMATPASISVHGSTALRPDSVDGSVTPDTTISKATNRMAAGTATGRNSLR